MNKQEITVSVPANHVRALEAYAARTSQPISELVYKFIHTALVSLPSDIQQYRPKLINYLDRERAEMSSYSIPMPPKHRQALEATGEWLGVSREEAGAALLNLGFAIAAVDFLKTFKAQTLN